MKQKHLLRILGLSAFLGLATLALPLSAHAGVRVSIGIGVPVVVAPAPVVVAPHRQPSCIPPRPWSWHRLWWCIDPRLSWSGDTTAPLIGPGDITPTAGTVGNATELERGPSLSTR